VSSSFVEVGIVDSSEERLRFFSHRYIIFLPGAGPGGEGEGEGATAVRSR